MQRLRRLIHNRPRLLIALAVGTISGICLPASWGYFSRALGGWNIGVWFYLALMATLMLRASPARARKMAGQEDENAIVILSVLSTAAVFSLLAITIELATVKDLAPILKAFRYVYTASTVIASWLLVGVIFAFHYAHVYFSTCSSTPPLAFPDDDTERDFWDFLYFSFTIAVAAQTSDIGVCSRKVRRVVLVQSIISFMFNAAILGLSINIAASMVSG